MPMHMFGAFAGQGTVEAEAGLALAPPSSLTTRLFVSVPTFSSYVMLSRGPATAETCPMLSPARASLHVINKAVHSVHFVCSADL